MGPVRPGWSRRLPNVLTTLRLAAVPPFVVLLAAADGGHSVPAGLLFGAASVTDYVDGTLARRWRVQSRYGRLLDPLADRLLIASAVVLLWHHGRIPALAVLLVLGRDVLLLSGLSLLAERGYELSVILLGKTATFVLMAALGLIMLTPAGTRWPALLLGVGIVLSVAAGAVYAVTVPKRLRASRSAASGGRSSRAS